MIFFGLIFGLRPFKVLDRPGYTLGNFSTFNIFAVGVLVFGLAYLLTGELAIPIGFHIAWNFFQGNVYGFPVSGNNFRTAVFVAVEQGGPDLWTGGACGPEAGLLGLGAIVVGAALIVGWVRLRRGVVALESSVALPPERKSPR